MTGGGGAKCPNIPQEKKMLILCYKINYLQCSQETFARGLLSGILFASINQKAKVRIFAADRIQKHFLPRFKNRDK
jgi:hypothetical protein